MRTVLRLQLLLLIGLLMAPLTTADRGGGQEVTTGVWTSSTSALSSAAVVSPIVDISEKPEGGATSRQIDTRGGAETTLEEGRKSKRGKLLRRIALPILLLVAVKAGLGLPLIFGAVSLAAFAGLWTGSTALLVTAALALRGLAPHAPRVVFPGGLGGHTHVTDYVAGGDYRRGDDYYRDDYYGRPGYGTWK